MGLLSEGTYDIVIEQFGAVELDRQSEYFMGSMVFLDHVQNLHIRAEKTHKYFGAHCMNL